MTSLEAVSQTKSFAVATIPTTHTNGAFGMQATFEPDATQNSARIKELLPKAMRV